MTPYLTCLCLLLLGGCATIDLAKIERPVSQALHLPSDTRLEGRYKDARAEHGGHSGFRLIDNGLEALSVRLELIDQAEKTLDLQYYILRSDISGLILLDHLLAAADRGVRIRILIDDLHFDKSGASLRVLDTHPKIEVRIINPFLYRHSLLLGRIFEILSDFGRVQRRMHNKLFIADNAVAIVGGRNLGDEYFEAHPRLDLRDLDLLTVGPVVPQLSASFDAYWNFEKTLPVAAIARHSSKEDRLHNLRRLFQNHKQRSDVTDYLQEVAAHPVSPWKMIWAKGTVLADFPCKLTPEQPHCASLNFDRFYGLFGKADSELMIISPYFIPGKDGIALFRHLRENKVRIRILTNSFAATDLKLVQAGYNRYRRSLLDEQVELYEFKPTFPLSHTRRKKRSAFGGPSQACMHAKAYVIDKKQVFVGSFNHDPRSAILNTEVGILIDSSELAAQLKTLFDRYTEPQNSYRLKLEPWKDGRKKLVWQTEEEGNMRTFHQEPLTSWWQHLKNALMAIFAPEDLL